MTSDHSSNLLFVHPYDCCLDSLSSNRYIMQLIFHYIFDTFNSVYTCCCSWLTIPKVYLCILIVVKISLNIKIANAIDLLFNEQCLFFSNFFYGILNTFTIFRVFMMDIKAYSLASNELSFEFIISGRKSINFSSVRSFFINSEFIMLLIVFRQRFFLSWSW